jgi:serine protease AprX
MNGGIAVTFAAGNEGSCCGVDSVRTPGDVPAMITVGATNCSDVIAGFSSRGPVTWQNVPPYNDWPYPPGKIKPEICAPGENTLSTSNNCSGYLNLSGTSMATPHVAGAIALMLQVNPKLTHTQVLDILKKTAKDLGPAGEENTYGSGRVDAYAAMKMAQSLACKADVNGDGVLDVDDFIYFQTLFGIKDPKGDFNGDGFFDADDFVDFQTAFGVGCP